MANSGTNTAAATPAAMTGVSSSNGHTSCGAVVALDATSGGRTFGAPAGQAAEVRATSPVTPVMQAAQRLADGHLVAFPTETVYGLGADANHELAVSRLFQIKGRPSDHPLIVHVASPDKITAFARQVPAYAHALIAAFWPGPLTVILPRKPDAACAAAGGQDSIGLRCPAHPMALSLLRACEKVGVIGLAAPSANRFGRVSPTTAAHVRQEFEDELAQDHLLLLDGGACQVGIESAIVDCTRGRPVLLRPGMLTFKDLQTACGEQLFTPSELDAAVRAAPRASGTLESHYAPRAAVQLLPPEQVQTFRAQPGQVLYVLPPDPTQAAHELFAKLRELDQPQVREIWVTLPPQGQAWAGVRDRLVRSAAPRDTHQP